MKRSAADFPPFSCLNVFRMKFVVLGLPKILKYLGPKIHPIVFGQTESVCKFLCVYQDHSGCHIVKIHSRESLAIL